jgi:hypothetical protein
MCYKTVTKTQQSAKCIYIATKQQLSYEVKLANPSLLQNNDKFSSTLTITIYQPCKLVLIMVVDAQHWLVR